MNTSHQHIQQPHKSIPMARGGQQMTRFHYKPNNDDIIVFLDSAEDFHKWLTGSTVPLAHVVQSLRFRTHNYVDK